jgi:hypothetical protein
MSIRPSNPAQSRISSLVQRHPLACFFVLAYLAAWCLWAPLLILRDTLPPAVAFILVLLGSLVPSTIAIVLVAIIRGRRGVRSLLGRLVKWRVGLRWYAVVLILPLLAPLGLGVSILLGGRPHSQHLRDRRTHRVRLLDLSRECALRRARLAWVRAAASSGWPQRTSRNAHSWAALGVLSPAALADRQRIASDHPLPGIRPLHHRAIGLACVDLQQHRRKLAPSRSLPRDRQSARHLPDRTSRDRHDPAILDPPRQWSSGLLALQLPPAPSASKPPKTSQRFRSRCP